MSSPSPSASATPAANKTHWLVLFVPGAGRHVSAGQAFHDRIGQATANLHRIFAQCTAGSSSSISVTTIDYHEELRNTESVGRYLSLITNSGSVPGAREMANGTVCDILMGMSSYHSSCVLDILARKMNEAYKNTVQEVGSERDEIKVCLVGYSLGGVYSYDLLQQQVLLGYAEPDLVTKATSASIKCHCRFHQEIQQQQQQQQHQQHQHQEDPESDSDRDVMKRPAYDSILYRTPTRRALKLNFHVDTFFTLGSPLSFVMVILHVLPGEHPLPEGTKYFNVFHQNDIHGYRIEPLYHEEYVNVAPVSIAGWQDKLTSATRQRSASSPSPTPIPQPAPLTAPEVDAMETEAVTVIETNEMPVSPSSTPTPQSSTEQGFYSTESWIGSYIDLQFSRLYSMSFSFWQWAATPPPSPTVSRGSSSPPGKDSEQSICTTSAITVGLDTVADKVSHGIAQRADYMITAAPRWSWLGTTLGDVIEGFMAHYSYISNTDVAAFVISQMLEIPVAA
ncbi:hypothetical protein GQ42DRAFT_156195 [Ramicandelaber brevisporus]|nr:hypothetical protein GQ42DRAFT_156195 [Ramicandelaber brevisporus]